MSQAFDPQQPAYERVSFVRPCVYCGARLAVFVNREEGSGETHFYTCPECGKDYSVHAAQDPLLHDAHFNLSRLHEKANRPREALRHLLAYRRHVSHYGE